MTLSSKPQVQEGDWVRGTSLEDERFRGYVESVRAADGLAAVRVTVCDRTEAVGERVVALLRSIEPIPVEPLREEGHLLNWIDLALSTGDAVWFRELSDELARLRAADSGKRKPEGRPVKNRIRLI